MSRPPGIERASPRTLLQGGKACLLIRKHGHFTPTREIRRHVRALARNHPEGWKLQGHSRKLAGERQWFRGGLVFGSCLRLIDSCITQLKAQGPSRTCNESKEEEEVRGAQQGGARRISFSLHARVRHQMMSSQVALLHPDLNVT